MNAFRRPAHFLLGAVAGILLTLPSVGATQPAVAEDEAKTVRSAAGRPADRGELQTRNRSTFVESEALTVQRSRGGNKSDSTTAAVIGEEAWFYDANVELFDDFDGDGHYTYLRVTFDIDSIYVDHYVYARLFLTLDGINWDEYHVTDDILIEGTSPFDDYEVETELVSGFPTGLYDALIEIYDADFGNFLAEFGPVDSSAFSLLPLEDIDNDTVQTTVVISSEGGGGGTTGTYSIFALFLLAVFAARNRQRSLRVV